MICDMPRHTQLVSSSFLLLAAAWLVSAVEAQEESVPSLSLEAIEAIQPPALPDEASAKMVDGQPPVAPPAPGVVDALPVPPSPPATSVGNRIPDSWVTPKPSPVVPSVSTSSSPMTKSTSTSGQFIVHGTALRIRNGVARRCEEVAESVRAVLKDKQPWVLPIVIHLRSAEESPATGPAVSTQITEMAHGGFHLQLTVLARPDLRMRDLESELFRVLLAERILRNQKAIVSKRERLLPDWVFTGVVEAATYRERTRPSALFSILFESGKIYGIEEIIEASPTQMDSLSRAIYDTSCCALVLALLDQGEGADRFAKFLSSLASDSRSERELLDQWFPSVAASPTSLNKWWALQMATLAQPTVAEPLSPAESYEAIKAALILSYEAPMNEAPPSAQPDLTPPPSRLAPVSLPKVVEAPAPKPVKKMEPISTPTPKPTTKTEALNAAVAQKAESTAEEPMADAEAEPESEVAEGEAEGGRSNVFGKLLGFLKKNSGEETTAGGNDEAAMEEDEDSTELAQDMPEPAPPEPEAKVEPEAKPEPKTEVAAASEMKEESSGESETSNEDAEPEKKKGFNPLRWFRNKKSKAEEEAAEIKEPGEDSASIGEPVGPLAWRMPDAEMALRWVSPSSALLFEQAQQWSGKGKPREVFLDFLKKKKKDGEADVEGEPASGESAPDKKTEAETKNTKETSKAEQAPVEEKKDMVGAEAEPAPKPKPTPKPKPKPVDLSKVVPIVKVRSPLSEYAWMMNRDDRSEILDRSRTSLQVLESRVGVLFRPVILGYLGVIEKLKKGETKGVDAALKVLDDQMEGARAMSNEVRDHLDWYEASHSGAYSGLFDEYLNLPETIEKEIPERTDPISEYLDALEAEFAR